MQKPLNEGSTRGNVKNDGVNKGIVRNTQTGQRPTTPPSGTGTTKKK